MKPYFDKYFLLITCGIGCAYALATGEVIIAGWAALCFVQKMHINAQDRTLAQVRDAARVCSTCVTDFGEALITATKCIDKAGVEDQFGEFYDAVDRVMDKHEALK